MVQHAECPLLLRGNVVLPDGTHRDRYILIRNGRIVSVSRGRPTLSENAVFVQTQADDWFFPGLLDLHTHSTYNILPLWSSPLAPFNNRFEWVQILFDTCWHVKYPPWPLL